jgi:dCMP deaminase
MQVSRRTLNYLELAKNIANWSKDPSTQVGAVAVGKHGQILAQGYYGFPRGIIDSEERLNIRELKYRYTVHGEMNCIYNAALNGTSLDGSDMYVYGLPVCSECAKGIIQIGVKRVFACYPETVSQKWAESGALTSEMFNETGVEYYQL